MRGKEKGGRGGEKRGSNPCLFVENLLSNVDTSGKYLKTFISFQ